MLGFIHVSRLLLVAFLLLYWMASLTYASVHPRLALYDIRQSSILSVTEWREIDFGDRSSIASGPQPARVYALQARLPIAGGSKTDQKDVRDYFLIPYCQKQSVNMSSPAIDVCSLHHYEGYVLLRFRSGWEVDFSAGMWRDATPSLNVMNAIRSFRTAINDSDATFPFPLEGANYPVPSEEFIRRYEIVERCNDLTDKCFQERYMTYTTSFKEFVWGQYTGRMIFHVGRGGALNGPWTLRLENTMPFDSATEVDVVVVLVDMEKPFNWSSWILSDPLGNILLCLLCLAWALSFILGTKELGIRLSHFIPVNEHRSTSLYDDELEGLPFSFLYRIMLATRESLMKLIWSLWNLKDACFYHVILLIRRREGQSRLATTVEATDQIPNQSREVEMRELHTNGPGEYNNCKNDDSSDEKEEDSERLCRICRCTHPIDDLFAPCACDGSAKYVHTGCLEKWRTMTSNEEHRRVCAECKTPYILVLERVSLSTDQFLGSPICVPAFKVFILRVTVLLIFLFQLWVGGYYLKLGMYVFTGLDGGIIWSAANLYHWVLGVYYIMALGLNMSALEYVLQDYTEVWQQLLLLIVSVWFLEIPLSYVGQILVSYLLNRTFTLEVSYGVGIIVMVILYVEVLPHLYEFLQSISTVREVVAPRRERIANTEPV